MFRQSLQRLGLSVEEGTGNVPRDGRYYVIHDGSVQGDFSSLKQALVLYQELKASRDPDAAGDRTG